MSTTLPAGGQRPRAADAELREQVVALLRRRRKFFEDAVAYLVINGLLWLIWVLTDRSTDGGLPWPAWLSIIWGFLLALDGWRAYSRLRRPITDAEIDAQLQRLRRN